MWLPQRTESTEDALVEVARRLSRADRAADKAAAAAKEAESKQAAKVCLPRAASSNDSGPMNLLAR